MNFSSSFQDDTFRPDNFRSTIDCDSPISTKIFKFTGTILNNDKHVPLNKDNMLLRECVLKNTDYVEGIVIYTGEETKAMLNNGGPRYKRR